jgi:hypothetical protein
MQKCYKRISRVSQLSGKGSQLLGFSIKKGLKNTETFWVVIYMWLLFGEFV